MPFCSVLVCCLTAWASVVPPRLKRAAVQVLAEVLLVACEAVRRDWAIQSQDWAMKARVRV